MLFGLSHFPITVITNALYLLTETECGYGNCVRQFHLLCKLNNDIIAKVSKNDFSILNIQPHLSSQQIRTLYFLIKNSATG